ncbi:hypothetical protein L1987_58056 [Smallanthus sonchifolius]|uniref:Uncharacterized protein n=1 Tax=Smallanthus sonchifolius TaxID=185202 RepID=A0ACB9DF83_9ASTR|nr:hypothetical protein L1987_58056 [Smallanthus sonchifolius]
MMLGKLAPPCVLPSFQGVRSSTSKLMSFFKTVKLITFLVGTARDCRLSKKSLDQDAHKGLTPLKLRAKAAKFAKATVKAQMASFKLKMVLLREIRKLWLQLKCVCQLKSDMVS